MVILLISSFPLLRTEDGKLESLHTGEIVTSSSKYYRSISGLTIIIDKDPIPTFRSSLYALIKLSTHVASPLQCGTKRRKKDFSV